MRSSCALSFWLGSGAVAGAQGTAASRRPAGSAVGTAATGGRDAARHRRRGQRPRTRRRRSALSAPVLPPHGPRARAGGGGDLRRLRPHEEGAAKPAGSRRLRSSACCRPRQLGPGKAVHVVRARARRPTSSAATDSSVYARLRDRRQGVRRRHWSSRRRRRRPKAPARYFRVDPGRFARFGQERKAKRRGRKAPDDFLAGSATGCEKF